MADQETDDRLPDRHFIRLSPGGRTTHSVTVKTTSAVVNGQPQLRSEVVNADGSPIVDGDGNALNWSAEMLTPERGFREVESHPAQRAAATAPHTPRTFALIVGDRVHEIIREVEHIEDEWHPEIVSALVDITDKPVEIGWVRRANGTLAAPPPYVPTRTEQMSEAAASGVEIVSGDLSGVYAVDAAAWERLRDEVWYVASFGSFSGDSKTLNWSTRDGEVTFSDADKFKAVARAISDWRVAWRSYVDEKSGKPPQGKVKV